MDLLPLMRRLKVLTKDLTVEPLEPNWAQQEFLQAAQQQMEAGKPIRIIVLKARQLGISTITEALMFWLAFLTDSYHGLVMAHENDSSEHLFGMTQRYWETFPFQRLYTPKYLSRKEIAWKETGSSIHVATARNVKTGRGRTIHALHASEVAFWDHPDVLMTGLRQTIPANPSTMIVVESTANGVGNYFHSQWTAAEDGETDFLPLFFPWWKHPEYRASHIGLEVHPLVYDSEEKVLAKMGCDDDHLIWRRWAIRNLSHNDINQFHQEYPSTPEEAFVSTGSNVFPLAKLRDCYDPSDGLRGRLAREGAGVRFQADSAGPVTLYAMPSKDRSWGKYIVAGDPTHTTMGDYASAQVINRRTYEQVATWHGRCDPLTFAEELAKLGKFYNDALLTTEIEGPGYGTIGRLVEMDYPNLWRGRWADKSPGKIAETYGWSTTMKRKEWAIGWLLKLVVDGDITIHDKRTFSEMMTFVTLPHGGYGNAEGHGRGHDDTVMALAIACICSSTDGPVGAYEREDPQPPPIWQEYEQMITEEAASF